MRITVFGATGRTGVPLVEQAVDRGHEVTAFARPGSELPVDDPAVTVVPGDAYEGSGVAAAVAGADAVASVLGQTSEGPADLLTRAGGYIVEAMAEHGVDRLVTLLGAGVREAGESRGLSGLVMGAALRLLARDVLEDARGQADLVRATDLDWTVVRAPRLTEEPPAGSYRAGDIALGFESIPRADVATFILDCIENELHVREMPKVGPG